MRHCRKIHKDCGREWDCYSQIKHQIVETLLWYAVMESYCRGDCNKNTNRKEKGKKDKRKSQIKQKAVPTPQIWGILIMHNIFVLLLWAVLNTNSERNQAAKEVATYNLPALNVMTHDDVTSPDLKSVLPQPFSLQSL